MNEMINKALNALCVKYGVATGKIIRNGTAWQLLPDHGTITNLLTHRVERRFAELKKIVEGKTLEDVSTLRFANFTAGGALCEQLIRELDLAVFLADSPIASLFSSGDAKTVCNVIIRFEDGKSGCVECGNGLPAGSKSMDRHELIARRGVASDRVVDSQVPQESIYLWTAAGTETYTDTDTELFGLPNDEILVVRAAFAVLKQPSLAMKWNPSFEKAVYLAEKALANCIR